MDAITWTPPTNGEVFRDIMEAYRNGDHIRKRRMKSVYSKTYT